LGSVPVPRQAVDVGSIEERQYEIARQYEAQRQAAEAARVQQAATTTAPAASSPAATTAPASGESVMGFSAATCAAARAAAQTWVGSGGTFQIKSEEMQAFGGCVVQIRDWNSGSGTASRQ
jgi:hypothetical protein